MKDRTLVAAILLLVFLIQPLSEIVEANFYPFGIPTFSLRSPSSNPYLSTNQTVETAFSYNIPIDGVQVEYFSFSLDNSTKLTLVSKRTFDYTYNKTSYTVSKTMENLTTGKHSIAFYAQFLNGTNKEIGNLTVVVDPTYKTPIPQVISPLNQTTYKNEVPIIFTLENGTVDYCFYTLDSPHTSNTTNFFGNTTLTNLPDGSYKLQLHIAVITLTKIHVSDFRDTFFFNVNKTIALNSPSLSSTQPVETGFSDVDYRPIVIAFVLLVIVALLSSLFYFKRKNRLASKQSFLF